MAFLVDTNVLVDVAWTNQGAVDYLESLDGGWSVSVVTAMELIVGARNKRKVAAIDRLLAGIPTLPLLPSTGASGYDLLRRFASSHGVGVFDALIAATALDEGLTLVTRNRKHFAMIPGLTLEVPRY